LYVGQLQVAFKRAREAPGELPVAAGGLAFPRPGGCETAFQIVEAHCWHAERRASAHLPCPAGWWSGGGGVSCEYERTPRISFLPPVSFRGEQPGPLRPHILEEIAAYAAHGK